MKKILAKNCKKYDIIIIVKDDIKYICKIYACQSKHKFNKNPKTTICGYDIFTNEKVNICVSSITEFDLFSDTDI